MKKIYSPYDLFMLFCLISSAMIEVADSLRAKPSVREVLRNYDIRKYEGIPTLEAYADAELANGTALSWGIELRYEENYWIVEAALRKNHRDGQDVLQEFPEIRTDTFEELAPNAKKATEWLIALAKNIDLSAI